MLCILSKILLTENPVLCLAGWNGHGMLMNKDQNLFSCLGHFITAILIVNSFCEMCCLEMEKLGFCYNVSSTNSKEV